MKNLTVNKLLTYLFIIVAIILLSITFAYNFFSKSHSNTDISIVDNYTPSTPISQENDEKFTIYTVKELDGVITVFENDEKIDIMLDSVLVSTLPEDDRKLIENGVEFTSYKELIAFLEDFE